MCNCCSSQFKNPIQFVIGDGNTLTPLNGSDTYNNSDLEDKPFLVFRNGFGYMKREVHYNKLTTGGFKLLPADVFNTGEVFTIQS